MSMRHTRGISLFYDTRVSHAVHANGRSVPKCLNQGPSCTVAPPIAANTRGRPNGEENVTPGQPPGRTSAGYSNPPERPPTRRSTRREGGHVLPADRRYIYFGPANTAPWPSVD